MKKIKNLGAKLLLFLLALLLINSYGMPMAYATEGQEEIDNEKAGFESSIDKDSLSEAEKKLSSNILGLTDSKYLPEGITRSKLIGDMSAQDQIIDASISHGSDDSSSSTKVYVYIQLEKGVDLNVLDKYVSKVENQSAKHSLVVAWIDVDFILSVADLDEVISIREVIPPVTNTGSVTSEGDGVLKTDQVRSQLSANGAGIKIGIISDGVDSRSTAISSNDLPADLDLHVLSNSHGGDEGTAMLEIVHDLAPGAELYFHDCGSNNLAFCDAIDALVDAGCNVICDDIAWITEPFFEDGIVAQHVESVLSSTDIVYVASAGNYGDKHYQGEFYDDGNGFHDFSAGTSTNDKDLYAVVPDGETITIILQWDDPFGSSANDYDLCLYDVVEINPIKKSEFEQNGDDLPGEAITWTNNLGSDLLVGISVKAYNISSPNTLEIYVYGAPMLADNRVAEDSIFGHKAVPELIACGAIEHSTPDTIEDFSSRGPVTMLTETRQKPDICGIDGVSVTGAGTFPSTFYGTSAAAPHVAAVAAILRSRFPSMDASEIRELIVNKGVDLGDSGYDNIYGYGRCDALASATSYRYVWFDSKGGDSVDTQLVTDGGKAVKPMPPIKDGFIFGGWYQETECNNEWIFPTETVSSDTTLFALWEDWVAQKEQIVSGKLNRTYYNPNGSIKRVEVYFGSDESSGINKINYYTNNVRTSYRLFNTDGQLKNLIDLYSDGKVKKCNYYNTSTGIRTQYKLYDTEGRMTHYIFCYSDGVKPQKTNYYNVNTGIRTQYKLYDTQGRTTHLIDCHPGGIKPKKTNYYNVNTGIRTQYKLYDTEGRTTHYATCYSDGVSAKKMNYYNVNTGLRSGYKTYRSNGTVSCYVKCDSNGDPSVATYYDENGNVTKVVEY